jgi:hypothetical protein
MHEIEYLLDLKNADLDKFEFSIISKFLFLFNLQIKLKKVLGLTVCSNAGLDVSPTTGILAYPAGYVFGNIFI